MARISGDDTSPRVEHIGPSDAYESRQCRLVTDATFEIDPAFAEPPYLLSVRWYDQDSRTISIDDGTNEQLIAGTGTQAWTTMTAIIQSRTFSLHSSGAAIHMLKATPWRDEEPEPPEPVDWASLQTQLDEIQIALDGVQGQVNSLGAAMEKEAAKAE